MGETQRSQPAGPKRRHSIGPSSLRLCEETSASSPAAWLESPLLREVPLDSPMPPIGQNGCPCLSPTPLSPFVDDTLVVEQSPIPGAVHLDDLRGTPLRLGLRRGLQKPSWILRAGGRGVGRLARLGSRKARQSCECKGGPCFNWLSRVQDGSAVPWLLGSRRLACHETRFEFASQRGCRQ